MFPSVDPYLDRIYDDRQYNCLHFTCEVWKATTGLDLTVALGELLAGPIHQRRVKRRHTVKFERVPAPIEPCLVLLLNPRTRPHAGVYIRGRMLHLTRRGVEYQPLQIASLFFRKQRFYQCRA
jgi:hypothetical protein